jgi:UDPglucose 6-dehydrogenase
MQTIDQSSIAIIGYGMVGSTLGSWFKNALIYDVDPQRSKNSLKEINQKCEYIFICVPTPFNKKNNQFDLSLVRKAISLIKGSKNIIIKSTILPGTTNLLQEEFANHAFLFSPEFLTEKTAKEDFQKPNMQILGYTKKSKSIANQIMNILPKAPYSLVTKAENAEAIKYFRNSFYATKVVFANQFYDFCQNSDIEYNVVKNAVKNDEMIAPSHLEIFHQGGRGAGGKCLSKDLKALAVLSKLPLLKCVVEANEEYLNISKK